MPSTARSNAQRRLIDFAAEVHGLASERFHCAGDSIIAAARRTMATSHAPIAASVRGRGFAVCSASLCAPVREAALTMHARANTAARAYIVELSL
jgi:hypothetical protein